MQFCFLNGEIIPLSEAKVGVEDIGLLRGYGVYEAFTALGGKTFRFVDHWNRFLDSAHALGLNIPVTEEKAERVIKELCEKNGLTGRSNVRFILTGGKAYGGIEYNFETPTFYILVEKHEPLPVEICEEGGKLITYPHLRFMPERKTTNYITAVNLQNYRKEEKAVEILYVHDGQVLECATSNIFLVKDNILFTPAENILPGITRKVVLELATSMEMSVEERLVGESELKLADEIFITSSFKDIVPITHIDEFQIGSGSVGPATKKLSQAFQDYFKSQFPSS